MNYNCKVVKNTDSANLIIETENRILITENWMKVKMQIREITGFFIFEKFMNCTKSMNVVTKWCSI